MSKTELDAFAQGDDRVSSRGVSLFIFCNANRTVADPTSPEWQKSHEYMALMFAHQEVKPMCFTSTDPYGHTDDDTLQLLYDQSFPSHAPVMHHVLATSTTSRPLADFQRIATCQNDGWQPCALRTAAETTDEIDLPDVDDAYVDAAGILLMDVVDNKDLPSSVRFEAALYVYTMSAYEHEWLVPSEWPRELFRLLRYGQAEGRNVVYASIITELHDMARLETESVLPSA